MENTKDKNCIDSNLLVQMEFTEMLKSICIVRTGGKCSYMKHLVNLYSPKAKHMRSQSVMSELHE